MIGGSLRHLSHSKPATPTCRTKSDCKQLKNSICVKGSCKCKSGFYRSNGKGQCKACLDHPPSKKLECVQHAPAPTPFPTAPSPTQSQEELNCRSKGFRTVELCIACTFLKFSAQVCEYQTDVDLSLNKLTGSIPSQIGLLTKLTALTLDDNLDLKGPIPTELGLLTKLTYIHISHNQLSGPIPTELGLLTELKVMNLSYNKLTASIPTELGNLSKNLATLILNNNELVGPIPTELTNLAKLDFLDLYSNQLATPIPLVITTFCDDPKTFRICTLG